LNVEVKTGAEILAYVNSDEAAEDRGLHCMEMEYSSPEHAVLQAKADAEIPASIDLSEAAEGSLPQCMEYSSPAHVALQAKADAEIPASIDFSEAAEGSLPQCMEYSSPAHVVLQAKADAERPSSVDLSDAAEGSWSQFMECSSPAHTVLHAKADAEIPVNSSENAEVRLRVEDMSPAHMLLPAKTDPEIPASLNLSGAAKDDSLQCTEYTSPADTDFQANTDAEISEKGAQDSRLECIGFTSPAHRAIKGKSSVKKLALENCSEVPKDSNTHPCMEFTSPAHTVPTFHPYADNVPTPNITASVSI
jgi:myb proto-oncogene protein